MAFLRWRRIAEIMALDRPAWGALLRRRPDVTPAAPSEAPRAWDEVYARGAYRRLAHSDQRHSHRLLASFIAEGRPAPAVLEVGCGEGVFLRSLKPFAPSLYVGLDVSPLAIERASAGHADDVAAGRARFQVADARTYEPGAGVYDAVVFVECLEYLGGLDTVIARYAPALKPGGVLGLSQWLAERPVRLWRELRALSEICDQAVILSDWGGAWVAATFARRAP